MKKLTFLLVFLVAAMLTQAQVAPEIYWVQFTDKANSPYSIDNPEAYLSPRALQRRANLNIAIDEYDIPVNPQYLQAVANCGVELLNPSKWLNGVSVYTDDASAMEAVNALPFVSEVRSCPNDPMAQETKERWMAMEMKPMAANRAMYGYYGGAEYQVKQLNVDVLHNLGFDGSGVVVAILDGGFYGMDVHPCFDNMREEGRLLGTRDYVFGSTTVYSQSTHGTLCLSTMAAYVPNTMVGTAPKASYYLIHTEDANSENIVEEYNWVSGAEYADSLGVDVCSTSLGYNGFDLGQWDHPFEHFDGHTAPMTIGAEIAVTRGMICVNAASNNGDGYCTLGIPGDAEHILTIGAVNIYGVRASFSSVGPTYDGRIKPDVMAMGEGTFAANGYSEWDEDYYNANGTSLSTPVLAGAVACLRQARPYASVQDVCDVIRACSDRADNPDSHYGYGIPDFSRALEMLSIEEPIGNTPSHIISVYPNPASDEVHVALNDAHKAEVTIYDVMGRVMFTYSFNGLNHTTLENYLNSLNTGVYFINAVSESGNETLKLVITK